MARGSKPTLIRTTQNQGREWGVGAGAVSRSDVPLSSLWDEVEMRSPNQGEQCAPIS